MSVFINSFNSPIPAREIDVRFVPLADVKPGSRLD